MIKFSTTKFLTICLIITLQQNLVLSKCGCEVETKEPNNKTSSLALKYKVIAIATTFVASLVGICIPILGQRFSFLNPENDLFFLPKAFAAGVILATGFIHILPEAFENLTNPCLSEKPWSMFPFTGFVAMVAAIGTLLLEAMVMGHLRRSELMKSQPLSSEDEAPHAVYGGQGHDHGHGHGHGHGIALDRSKSEKRLRNIIVSQILELGIIVHSIIIGISLGVSGNPKAIKPLLAALSFHQCFEGIGLGGSISQAQYKNVTTTIMVVLFCLTMPIGIGVGIGVSKVYDPHSQKALIVEGLLLAASGGVLIYMALVDLLATDFMDPKMLSRFKLQLGASFALLLGMSCMSLLALLGA
ncbi:unnamed protein product [Lupinus luteus]|uniref:Uncharacterized protein n=1 Tax=Lupinus luteus TaxID=3873 RepID=A0AAV1VPS4_LUPLU